MKDELITFETAVLAKEKGFDCHCMDTYYQYNGSLSLCHPFSNKSQSCKTKGTKDYYAPTQSLLQRWLRERYNMTISIYTNASGFLWERMDTVGGTHRAYSEYTGDCPDSGAFTTYEKALEAGLREALKLIKI